MIFTIAMLFYALTMSQLLQLLRDWRWKYTLFFGLAVLFGLIDILFYTKVRPPEKAYLPWFHTSPEQKRQTFTMHQFLMPLRDSRYRAYLLFTISWSFSMQISGPYYNVYMFNDLKFSLGQMTLLSQIIPAIATILFLRRIGRAFDHYGFKPILILSCGVSLVLPVSWMFATVDSNWFVYLSNVLSGIFNIGIDLAIMSLAIFLAPHAERSAYLAMKSIAMALLGFVPAIMIGGFLSDLLRPVLLAAQLPFFRGQVMNPFHVLLILTFCLRLTTLLVFARRLHEPTAMSFSDFVAHANATHLAQLRRSASCCVKKGAVSDSASIPGKNKQCERSIWHSRWTFFIQERLGAIRSPPPARFQSGLIWAELPPGLWNGQVCGRRKIRHTGH
ncbi:MAG: MFS transporter [Clostridiales bacterium]|nr:MFS transporter [Clostridiales bacterium]